MVTCYLEFKHYSTIPHTIFCPDPEILKTELQTGVLAF